MACLRSPLFCQCLSCTVSRCVHDSWKLSQELRGWTNKQRYFRNKFCILIYLCSLRKKMSLSTLWRNLQPKYSFVTTRKAWKRGCERIMSNNLFTNWCLKVFVCLFVLKKNCALRETNFYEHTWKGGHVVFPVGRSPPPPLYMGLTEYTEKKQMILTN